MNKKKFVFCALAATIVLSFSGCAKVYELSENDEDMIAVYCAKTVSKFNTIKQQGYVNLIGADLKEQYALRDGAQQTEEEVLPEDETIGEEPGEDAFNAEEDLTGGGAIGTGAEDASVQASGSTSLTDALAINGLTFDYKSVAAMDYYSIGGYANITPTKGKQFLVVTYNVINTTNADVAVDIPSSGIKFKASVGGASNTADGTIVPTDLSIYKGAIAAGHTQEMVLLFQFEPDALSDLSGLTLQVVSGTTATNILF